MSLIKRQVIPTILVKTAAAFKERVARLGEVFPLIQIDVADGKFVKNKTFADASIIRKIKTPVGYELHLMVKSPAVFVDQWKKVTNLQRVIFHYESVPNNEIERLIKNIVQCGCEVGIAVNPGTPVAVLKPWLKQLDIVLVMGVDPGFNGSPFKRSAYTKLKSLRKLNPKLSLGIDGGVNPKRAAALRKAGATILYSGSYLWSQPDLKHAKQTLLIK